MRGRGQSPALAAGAAVAAGAGRGGRRFCGKQCGAGERGERGPPAWARRAGVGGADGARQQLLEDDFHLVLRQRPRGPGG